MLNAGFLHLKLGMHLRGLFGILWDGGGGQYLRICMMYT